jgi:hypothetical protein
MRAGSGTKTLTGAGPARSGGATLAQTDTSVPADAPEASSAADLRETTAGPSWESACACPQLCLRDHERD